MVLRPVAVCLALGLATLSGALSAVDDDERPSFFRRRKEPSIVVEQRTTPMRVHVTSIGGVGTTGFMEELKNMTPPIFTNDPIDNDQIKHVPYSKLIESRSFKRASPDRIVYLYGDPMRAVMSVDRRGWFMIQARKTRTDPFPHPFPKNLHQYVNDMQEDFFQFEKHFDSFYKQCDIPVAFLRISEKTDHVKELAAFLRTDPSVVKRVMVPWKPVKMFATDVELELMDQEGKTNSSVVPLAFNPDILPSNNTYEDVPQETKDKLKQKLQSLIKKYADLPGFKAIIPGKDCQKH